MEDCKCIIYVYMSSFLFHRPMQSDNESDQTSFSLDLDADSNVSTNAPVSDLPR